jgi:arsenate reductase (glutaredoxin)
VRRGTPARIYHNPRCTKSRETLALLETKGVELEVIEYLKDPPSVAELKRICAGLSVHPLAITRTREPRFAELGLSRDDDRGEAEWLRILHENPVLIERPLVLANGKVALGRPPANALGIL